MRYRYVLLFCLSLLLNAASGMAQEKAKITKATIEKKGSATVSIVVTSSQDFLMGNNRYVLHIGNAQFDRYLQGQDEDNRKLVFLVPVDAYNQLSQGASMYLVYGDVDEQQIETLCKDSNFPCWSLGTFSKK